jgi:predicted RNase H-like nuclease
MSDSSVQSMTVLPTAAVPLAGVDGCPAGFIAAVLAPGAVVPCVLLAASFGALLAELGDGAVIGVDMPIGLPERTGAGGRGPEAALRPHLGARQSSVFAIPSRAAVYAADYGEACRLAAATSEPSRKVSKQGFFLFPKIREIDTLLRGDPALVKRVHEVHPEGAFMLMNGGRPLSHPKKCKGVAQAPGLLERLALLERAGFPRTVLEQRPPRGAAVDDQLDAFACLWSAARIAAGVARRFPEQALVDAHGIPIVISA